MECFKIYHIFGIRKTWISSRKKWQILNHFIMHETLISEEWLIKKNIIRPSGITCRKTQFFFLPKFFLSHFLWICTSHQPKPFFRSFKYLNISEKTITYSAGLILCYFLYKSSYYWLAGNFEYFFWNCISKKFMYVFVNVSEMSC